MNIEAIKKMNIENKKCNNINKLFTFYLTKPRAVLIVGLLCTICFYSAFRVIKWKNESISLIFNNCYIYFELLKRIFTIILLIIEIISLLYKLLSKKENAIHDSIVFLLYFSICMTIKLFVYSERYIYLTIIIYFSRYIEFKSLIKTYVFIYSISLITIVIGNISGNLSLIAGGRGYAFGFIHSNDAALFLFMYYMALSYLINSKKMNITIGLLMEIIVLFFNKSRTPAILIMVYIIMLLCENMYKKINTKLRRILEICFCLSPLLLLCLSLILGLLIINNIIIIDANAGIRFTEMIRFINENGISLSYFELSELKTLYYLDNGYGHLLFRYGLICYIIISFGQTLSNIVVVKNNDYKVYIMLICLYIYNLMEFISYFNDLPLLMIAYINESSNKKYVLK